MFKFKSTLIALAITFLMLAGFVKGSDAFEIEELSPLGGSYEEYDWSGTAYPYAYIKTSEPFALIEWYVDGSYVGYSDGDGVKTEAYIYNLSSYGLAGTLSGTTYTIKAKAWGLYDESALQYPVDEDSYTI